MRNDVITHKLIMYIDKIMDYCDGLSYAEFVADTKLVEACVFNLSQMGELVNKLDSHFTELHAQIPWRAIYGLRNRIVHDYEGVNLTLIWDIVSTDLPDLKAQLVEL